MKHVVIGITIVAVAVTGPGCATILRGTSQTVGVQTHPAGGTVVYQGRELEDGGRVLIQKRFEPPRFNAGGFPVDMSYDPDPLLIGDALLLLIGVVPGLVALGIDFGTGAWRNLHDPQIVHLPKTVSRATPEAAATR